MENYLSYVTAIGVAILLIVQIAVFVGFYFLAKRLVALAERASQLQTRAEYVLNNTEPALKLAHSLMGELKQAADYFAQGAQHISAIAEMAKSFPA